MAYTLAKLIERFQADTDSPYHRLSYDVRAKHDRLLARIVREKGSSSLRHVSSRTLIYWHRDWTADGKNAMASALMARLRVLFRYGATELADWDCRRLSEDLSLMRFPTSSETFGAEITEAQAIAIREKAREVGLFSVALAQAIQFEMRLGQKDIIGEWLPLSEPGPATLTTKRGKWRRGLLWSSIGADLKLRHLVGADQEPVELDLKAAPMVMVELAHAVAFEPQPQRDAPLVVCEMTALPWKAGAFRRNWRKLALMAGVPPNVRNAEPVSLSRVVAR